MKKKILLIIFISLFMTNSIYAANFAGHYSCGKVITYDKDNNLYAKESIVSWFRGFYSGVNMVKGFEQNDYPDDADSIYYAVVKFCKDNPLKDSADASIDIYNEITDNYLNY
jgi:hypothetical protein